MGTEDKYGHKIFQKLGEKTLLQHTELPILLVEVPLSGICPHFFNAFHLPLHFNWQRTSEACYDLLAQGSGLTDLG